MNRAICLCALASALGAADLAWAGAPETGAPIVSGVSFVQFNAIVGSAFPAGSIILCKAELVSSSNESSAGESQHRRTPLGEATIARTLRGSTAECALEIPFSWTGNWGRSEIAVHYEIDAISRPGAVPVVLARGAETGLRIAQSRAASFVRIRVDGVR